MVIGHSLRRPVPRLLASVPPVGLIMCGVALWLGPVGLYFWIFAFPIVPILIAAVGAGRLRFRTPHRTAQAASFVGVAVTVAAFWVAWMWLFLGGRGAHDDRWWAVAWGALAAAAAMTALAVTLPRAPGMVLVRALLVVTAAGLVGVTVANATVVFFGAVLVGFPASLITIGLAALPTRGRWLVGALGREVKNDLPHDRMSSS